MQVFFIVIVSLLLAAVGFFTVAEVLLCRACRPKREKRENRFKAWWKTHKPSKRRLIQLYVALLVNANIKGFFTGQIYTGGTKYACIPGLNCYSCPGAVGACPLGALQNAFAQSGTRTPAYVFGIIVLFGLLLGRTICGFLCPIGLGQELLYKIKTPKIKKSRVTRVFSYLKYVLLVVFVVALPLLYSLQNVPLPAFCKYVCPAGTFGGALGLLINPKNADLYGMLGPLFTWKFVVLCVTCVASVFLFRFFCRFLCPLGAIYGFFNRVALLGVKVDKDSCTGCGSCISHCKMDIRRVGDHECINCGECIKVCPAKAISWRGSKLFLHKNATAVAIQPQEEVRPLGALLHANAAENSSVKEQIAIAEAPATETLAEKKPRRKRGRSFWLRFAAWGAALVVLVGALVYYNFIDASAEAHTGNQVGDIAPDFTLSVYLGEEGDTFTVSEQRGKILILNFWTTYCTPCIEEIPRFERIANEYADNVSVAIVHGTGVIEDVEAFILAHGWGEYTAVFAQDDLETNIYAALGGKGSWPMTIIIDEEGIISYVLQGGATYEMLKEQVELLLK